jgi:hypothetical protein
MSYKAQIQYAYGSGKAQGQRSVVAPGASRLVVRAERPVTGYRVGIEHNARPEIDGNTKRVADRKADDATKNALALRHGKVERTG